MEYGGNPFAGPRPTNAPAGPGARTLNFGAFEKVLHKDFIPFIDANFRTLPDQPHRAMAGLSMGGMQTRSIALPHLDTFSHIGVFSGGSIALTNITDLASFKEKVKLVFISYGVTFVELLSVQGNDIRITFTGKVTGNEIKFTRQAGDFGSSEATAKREGGESQGEGSRRGRKLSPVRLLSLW
jgi:hypothetical protein